MDDSSMDLTAVVCNSTNEQKKQLLSLQEKNEEIIQENYELRKKIELLERVNEDMESELSFISSSKLKEKTKQSDLQRELNSAHCEIKHLESQLEDKELHLERLMKEAQHKAESVVSTIVVPDQDQLNILTGRIINLETLLEESHLLKQQLVEEKADCINEVDKLKTEIKSLQSELKEVKEILNQKNEEVHSLNDNLDSLREEKLLLNAELQMIKSSDHVGSRGNSLFAEVEENRQKAVGQRELLKLKYLNLKKILNQKQSELNKLKLEIVQIRREEKEDEKSIHRDYSVLINTLKTRISELECESKSLKQVIDKKPALLTEGDLHNFQLVNSILDDAKKEAKTLQEKLDLRCSNYVLQGHQLFDSQKENRRLKACIKKLQSDKDELKLKLDVVSAGKENIEDGISPPATEIAIEYQKQKTIRFQEAITIHNRSHNDEDSKEEIKDILSTS